MSTHLKKANLTLILILLIGLCLPGNANAASENSAAYSTSFGKSSPANNTSVNTTGVTLQWGSISSVFQYRYCYYSYDLTSNVCDIADKSTWISSGTSRSVQLPTLALGKTYYWQVGAKLTDNSFVFADGDLTARWKFTTGSTVGAGIYDNTNSNWAFSGKWAALTGTGPYGDTYKESRDIPDFATFSFTGSRFQLFYTQKPDRGVMNLYLDGSTTPIPINQSGPQTFQKPWMSDPLTLGNHTAKFVYVSGGYVDIDAIQIFPQADTTAPAAITTLLAATGTNAGTVALTWTAVGDDGTTGTANSYLVRYSTSAISDETAWTNATPITKGVPTPKAAGQPESMTVSGLTMGSTYYFAIRARDEQSNTGALSNSPSAVAFQPSPAGVGTYDDTAPQWYYSGNWATTTTTGPYNNTIHYTNTTGATASFTFQAPAIFSFYYAKFNQRGKFEIWIDGNSSPLATIDPYATTKTWQNKYVSPAFTDSAAHTVTIKNISTGGQQVDIDAIQILDIPGPAGPGIYDDTDLRWTYSAGWTAYTTSGPYNSTIHYTNATNATASFTFQAPATFTFYYAKYNQRGKFEIWIDGNSSPLATIDPYATTKTWQNKYVSPAFTDSATHTVTIKNISTGGQQVDIDAIQITSPVGAGTYDDTDAHWTYTGSFTVFASSSAYKGGIHYTTTIGDSAAFTFTGSQFTLVFTGNTNRGKLDVYVDDNPVAIATIDEYTATSLFQQEWTSTSLGAGAHTIKLIHAGPVGTTVNFDAIKILP